MTDDPATGARRHFVAYTQSDLLAYFRERHAHGERWRLREISSRYEAARDIAHILYTVSRSGDDPGVSERRFEGKGAISCARQQLFVWSMANR